MLFNERLRLLREERQMTQEKVARGMDMPVRSYQRLELNGKTHYDTMIKIADFMMCLWAGSWAARMCGRSADEGGPGTFWVDRTLWDVVQ